MLALARNSLRSSLPLVRVAGAIGGRIAAATSDASAAMANVRAGTANIADSALLASDTAMSGRDAKSAVTTSAARVRHAAIGARPALAMHAPTTPTPPTPPQPLPQTL